MMHIELQRFRQDIVTFGKLDLGIKNQLIVYTLELPWHDNQTGISCIPEGVYNFFPFKSPTKGDVWKAVYVPGRNDIEIHSGNYASDGVNNGIPFESQVKGCILVGLGIDDKVPMITKSRDAMKYLKEAIGKSGFSLEVKNP